MRSTISNETILSNPEILGATGRQTRYRYARRGCEERMETAKENLFDG